MSKVKANGGFEISGIENVKKLLEEIAPKHARNLLRATTHGVAAEITKRTKVNAPEDTGNLKKSIKTKRKKSHPDNPISRVIFEHGPDKKNDGYHWRFVEYGTGGKNIKAERPFFRPAMQSVLAEMPKIVTQQFAKKLEAKIKAEQKKRNKV